MVLGIFKRKPKQPRNSDGTFGSWNGDGAGSARSLNTNFKVVADTIHNTLNLAETLEEAGLRRLERQARYNDMLTDIEGAIESDGEPSFENMAMQLILSQVQNKQTPISGDPWTQGVFYDGNPRPGIPEPNEGAGGVDRLNQVLGALNKIPDKVISEKAIDKVCEIEGIDKGSLKGVIKKLSPVLRNG